MQALPVALFVFFVGMVLVLSFFFARKARSAAGYYAAGSRIHWSVNGIAFAGDYLSAASFLGICGMIATSGYDGFLYSIGFLAGWVVALFVVAEPIKRLGKYTFADAIDAKFNSKGIKLAAAVSALVVSVCYLIPQMVGAGALVTPLLGLSHHVGVIIVGAIVITIVATAGMTSTTYVQFIKGGLLVCFSVVLVIALLSRGLSTEPQNPGYRALAHQSATMTDGELHPADAAYAVDRIYEANGVKLAKLVRQGIVSWWKLDALEDGGFVLRESQYVAASPDGGTVINGRPAGADNQLVPVGNMETVAGRTGDLARTGPVGPFRFLSLIQAEGSSVRLWRSVKLEDGPDNVTVYYPQIVEGNRVLLPGLRFGVKGTALERIDFVSLMLALFLGTAALPHILIRYYTVPSQAAARKSTIVAIAAIGAFYILTLFMGLGAMTGGVVNLVDENMSAPLLARSFGTVLFAMISAIAFATVLGTVSGLIIAASGAVAHDILDRLAGIITTDAQKVVVGKIVAFAVGAVAIILGIIFKGVNVSFLVGLAFAVAASANLPAILLVLFWKRVTARGVAASILVGVASSLLLILLSPTMYEQYGLDPATAVVPLRNPGIVSIPLSFLTAVLVSLATGKGRRAPTKAVAAD